MQIANIKLQNEDGQRATGNGQLVRFVIRHPSSVIALLGVLGVLAVNSLLGCGVLGGGQPDEGGFIGPTGRAVLTIYWPTLPEAQARGAVIYTHSLTVKVFKGAVELRALRTSVSRPDGQAVTTVTIDNVPVGLTTFAGTAHLTTDGSGVVLASGSTDATIAGGTNSVSIPLTPLGLIAFQSDRDGNWEIYVMNEDGTGQTRLTGDPSADEVPHWSPDGGKLLFYSYREGIPEVFVMNADGSGQTNLSNNPAWDAEPSWSPDGTKIVFISDRDSGTGIYDIYVMNADGTGQIRLTNNSARDERPAWSPDGTKIAFHSWRDGNQEIYVMNADGTGQTNLTNNPAVDEWPAWSPDGTRITFESTRDGNSEIYLMNADGTGQTRLTYDPSIDLRAAWSPEGSRIVFWSDRAGDPEVYMMNADGTGQMRLTYYPGSDFHPDWTAGYGGADVVVRAP